MDAYLSILAERITIRNLVEVFFVAATIFWYQRLKRIELQALLPVALCVLVVDAMVSSNRLPFYLFPVSLVEFSCVVLGVIRYKRMKRNGMTVLITLTFLDLILDLAAVQLADRGIFNLFIYNFFHFISVPIWYYFFFLHLKPRGKALFYYILLAIISFSAFSYEYFSNTAVKLTTLTTVVLCTQLVIFGFLTMGRLVMREVDLRPLTQEPLFWICCGTIIEALTLIPVDGLHNYLVAEHVEIYTISTFLANILPTVSLFKYLCYFYGFCLAIRKPIPGIGRSGPIELDIPPILPPILPVRISKKEELNSTPDAGDQQPHADDVNSTSISR